MFFLFIVFICVDLVVDAFKYINRSVKKHYSSPIVLLVEKCIPRFLSISTNSCVLCAKFKTFYLSNQLTETKHNYRCKTFYYAFFFWDSYRTLNILFGTIKLDIKNIIFLLIVPYNEFDTQAI